MEKTGSCIETFVVVLDRNRKAREGSEYADERWTKKRYLGERMRRWCS